MIDVKKAQEILGLVNEAEEKIADRGPIKVLPRPPAEIPNVPALQAGIALLQAQLRVRRNYKEPKGHDLDNQTPPGASGYDLSAIGVIDAIKTVNAGTDRALPKAATLVRVDFPGGEHLWFDPADLDPFDPSTAEAEEP